MTVMTAAVPAPTVALTCGPIILTPQCTIPVSHYRGDSATLAVSVWQDADHTIPADLSAATVSAMFKLAATDPVEVAHFDVTVTDNVVTLYVSPTVSRDLPAKAVWDMQIDWFSDDAQVSTPVVGTWTETQDVTW